MRDTFAFIRQFRTNFETTGALTPSSRFLARTVTRYLARHEQPVRILECGPGTGVVTRRIVQCTRPGDRVDLVELNPEFAAILERQFRDDPLFQTAADRCRVHVCPIQEFTTDQTYDYIVSGLPLNNFPPELVTRLFDRYLELLAPGGILSYFEYVGVRKVGKLFAGRERRARLSELEAAIAPYWAKYRVRRDCALANLPPAWVHHLRRPES